MARTLDYDDWVEAFSPEQDDSGLVQYPVWGDVPNAAIEENRVWAVIEGEDEHTCAVGDLCPYDDCEEVVSHWAIMPGYHLVDVVYFTVTAVPYPAEMVAVDWSD